MIIHFFNSIDLLHVFRVLLALIRQVLDLLPAYHVDKEPTATISEQVQHLHRKHVYRVQTIHTSLRRMQLQVAIVYLVLEMVFLMLAQLVLLVVENATLDIILTWM